MKISNPRSKGGQWVGRLLQSLGDFREAASVHPEGKGPNEGIWIWRLICIHVENLHLLFIIKRTIKDFEVVCWLYLYIYWKHYNHKHHSVSLRLLVTEQHNGTVAVHWLQFSGRLSIFKIFLKSQYQNLIRSQLAFSVLWPYERYLWNNANFL